MSKLRGAVREIYATVKDRYEVKLKPGREHLTENEGMGIIAGIFGFEISEKALTTDLKSEYTADLPYKFIGRRDRDSKAK